MEGGVEQGLGIMGTQTSFVQSMKIGKIRKQMKLTHGKGIVAVILGM